MIPNQWYAVLESGEVKPGRPVGVVRMAEKLVFWRDSHGRVACQRDMCAHRGAALSAGKVLGDTVQCPFHGLRYDGSGRCTMIPANGRNAPVPPRFQLFRYPVLEANGFIYIWWGEDRENLPPAPFFTDIGGDFSYATVRDPWKTHYSRCIENQLDTVHLPFVHYNTIGRGNRTLVNGPRTVWIDDDSFFIYVDNRVDVGQTPLKPDEVRTSVPFRLEFIFPNLWQNHISEDFRIVVAFVPVDEENTILRTLRPGACAEDCSELAVLASQPHCRSSGSPGRADAKAQTNCPQDGREPHLGGQPHRRLPHTASAASGR
jgi:phenylpropionate dioxygenase-like ring-hydroxylating dioxygenase large terminal subunit